MDDTITLWYTVARGNADRPVEGQPFRVAWYDSSGDACFSFQLADDDERGPAQILIPWHAISTLRIGPGAPRPQPMRFPAEIL